MPLIIFWVLPLSVPDCGGAARRDANQIICLAALRWRSRITNRSIRASMRSANSISSRRVSGLIWSPSLAISSNSECCRSVSSSLFTSLVFSLLSLLLSSLFWSLLPSLFSTVVFSALLSLVFSSLFSFPFLSLFSLLFSSLLPSLFSSLFPSLLSVLFSSLFLSSFPRPYFIISTT